MTKNSSSNTSRRIVSLPIQEDLYHKIEQHAMIQNGGNIQDCLASAISEVVELWDDYDQLISSLKTREKIPLF